MPRLLVLGFSNTALRAGYTGPLKTLLAERHPELELFVCGLGGLSPHVVPVAFDRMQQRHGPFSHVVLEIATSVYARSTTDTPEQAGQLILDCLNRAAEAGARPALLHLFRTDLTVARLPFARLLTEAATEHGYPVVDLAEGLVQRKGEEFVRGLLRDTVHTTPEGSLFQAEELLAALDGWLRSTVPATVPPRPALRRLGLALHLSAGRAGLFHWQDFLCETGVIEAGENLTLALPEPLRVFGLTYLVGPRTGRLEFGLDERIVPIEAFDEHAHFTRLGLRVLPPAQQGPVRRVSIRQDPAMPQVVLKRGTPDHGPREGQVVDLLHLG
ncbi:hypothetical protein SAMN02745194_00358 [Roseomonas rosea]|uniref:Uncharacterized protein n=1 Tax=Muricoccus roseus TaxID=198092 RepID=A0A1M6B4C6_9PROT|nr:SGNH/GDSL hydrolase family protein [Roseomonas rosea]SHI43581.1 hypothetical protein SAMN02745194_00358 [Roseomonas rosea]